MRSVLSRVATSRFFIAPAVLAVMVIAWNLYVSQHNDGVVRGRVVGAHGEPIAGATVVMTEQNFTTNADRGRTLSLAGGSFEFTDNRSHSIQLRAQKAGLRESPSTSVRLYFRAQNVTLREPLRMGSQDPSGATGPASGSR